MVKSTILVLAAMKWDRDKDVQGQKPRVIPDQLKELPSEIGSERFQAFVLEEDDGVGQRPLVYAEAAGRLKPELALCAIAALRRGFTRMNGDRQDLAAEAAHRRQNRLKGIEARFADG